MAVPVAAPAIETAEVFSGHNNGSVGHSQDGSSEWFGYVYTVVDEITAADIIPIGEPVCVKESAAAFKGMRKPEMLNTVS